jgi:hypothetical protein
MGICFLIPFFFLLLLLLLEFLAVLKSAVPDGMKGYYKDLESTLREYIQSHPEPEPEPPTADEEGEEEEIEVEVSEDEEDVGASSSGKHHGVIHNEGGVHSRIGGDNVKEGGVKSGGEDSPNRPSDSTLSDAHLKVDHGRHSSVSPPTTTTTTAQDQVLQNLVFGTPEYWNAVRAVAVSTYRSHVGFWVCMCLVMGLVVIWVLTFVNSLNTGVGVGVQQEDLMKGWVREAVKEVLRQIKDGGAGISFGGGGGKDEL